MKICLLTIFFHLFLLRTCMDHLNKMPEWKSCPKFIHYEFQNGIWHFVYELPRDIFYSLIFLRLQTKILNFPGKSSCRHISLKQTRKSNGRWCNFKRNHLSPNGAPWVEPTMKLLFPKKDNFLSLSLEKTWILQDKKIGMYEQLVLIPLYLPLLKINGIWRCWCKSFVVRQIFKSFLKCSNLQKVSLLPRRTKD